MKELIEALIQEVEETEVRRRWQLQKAKEEAERRERLRLEEEERRRWEAEAIRRRRLMEEKERRERQELVRKIQREIDKAYVRLRNERLLEYLVYYERYHQIKREADDAGEQLANQGLSRIQVEELKKKFMEFIMKDWPQQYRSKCTYTEMEKLAFLIDPLQSAMWTNLLPT